MTDDCIQGPCEGMAHSGVTNVDTYRAYHRKVKSETRENAEPQTAYINHGRWVVDCQCKGAGLTSRIMKIACCFDCGAVYTQIVFPRNAKSIENVLLKRPDLTTRNWKHGESIGLLLSDNKAHGVNC
jgi:hypothetical protein